jgi:hypothetical protein
MSHISSAWLTSRVIDANKTCDHNIQHLLLMWRDAKIWYADWSWKHPKNCVMNIAVGSPVTKYCDGIKTWWYVSPTDLTQRIHVRGTRVTGEWRKIHNEERNVLYCSPNIIRVIKTRMRWTGQVARTGREEVHTGFWWGKDHLEDPGVDGRIILRWIFRKWDVGGHGLDWFGSG